MYLPLQIYSPLNKLIHLFTNKSFLSCCVRRHVFWFACGLLHVHGAVAGGPAGGLCSTTPSVDGASLCMVRVLSDPYKPLATHYRLDLTPCTVTYMEGVWGGVVDVVNMNLWSIGINTAASHMTKQTYPPHPFTGDPLCCCCCCWRQGAKCWANHSVYMCN